MVCANCGNDTPDGNTVATIGVYNRTDYAILKTYGYLDGPIDDWLIKSNGRHTFCSFECEKEYKAYHYD